MDFGAASMNLPAVLGYEFSDDEVILASQPVAFETIIREFGKFQLVPSGGLVDGIVRAWQGFSS